MCIYIKFDFSVTGFLCIWGSLTLSCMWGSIFSLVNPPYVDFIIR